jgi:hypothetical protein
LACHWAALVGQLGTYPSPENLEPRLAILEIDIVPPVARRLRLACTLQPYHHGGFPTDTPGFFNIRPITSPHPPDHESAPYHLEIVSESLAADHGRVRLMVSVSLGLILKN